MMGTFKGVHAQILNQWQAQRYIGFGPDFFAVRTRNPPSQVVFFSPAKIVVPPSGQVILAELAGHVPFVLQQSGYGRIFFTDAFLGARPPAPLLTAVAITASPATSLKYYVSRLSPLRN